MTKETTKLPEGCGNPASGTIWSNVPYETELEPEELEIGQ